MTTKPEGDASASVDPNKDENPANSSEAEDGRQEAEQSTDVNQDTGASSDTGEDGKPAESSTAEGDKEPESLLDAVTKATEQETETKAEKSPGSEGKSEDEDGKSDSEDGTGESEDDGSGELTDKELEALKPKTRKRMEYLSGQVSTLKPRAEAMDQLVRYCTEADLNTEEVNKGFDIMRLMKSNPFEALEALRPYVSQLYQLTGTQLPENLQEQVKQGLISEDHARALVQGQTRTYMAQAAANRASQEAETLRTRQEQQTAVNDVATAVSDWERQWASTDPDYQRKQEFVQKEIELGLRNMRDRGEQPTRQSIIELANVSKAAVEKRLKGLIPHKQPVTPLPNGQGSAPATREPQSLMDAMTQAANGS